MKKTICKNCICYQPIYLKGIYNFKKEQQGICCACQNIVEENARCELYAPNPKIKTTTVQALDAAIADIKALKKLYSQENLHVDKKYLTPPNQGKR